MMIKYYIQSDDSSPLIVGYFDLATHKAEKVMFEDVSTVM